jgi:toxin FitB
MIILDTNVVSEPMKPKAYPAVRAWLDAQARETLFLTATSLSELLVGVEILPAGKRKTGLGAALTELLAFLFGPRILAFDQQAAGAYAALVSRAKAQGFALSTADAQIAAIATINGYTVATRDTTPFIATGVEIVNPWGDRF